MGSDHHWRHLQCTRLDSNLNTTKNLKGWKQKKNTENLYSVIFTKTNLLAVCIDVHPEKKNVVIYETCSNWKWKEDSATSESKRMLFDEINLVIQQWNSLSHQSDILSTQPRMWQSTGKHQYGNYYWGILTPGGKRLHVEKLRRYHVVFNCSGINWQSTMETSVI